MIDKKWMRFLSLCMVFVIVLTASAGCTGKQKTATAEYCPTEKVTNFIRRRIKQTVLKEDIP